MFKLIVIQYYYINIISLIILLSSSIRCSNIEPNIYASIDHSLSNISDHVPIYINHNNNNNNSSSYITASTSNLDRNLFNYNNKNNTYDISKIITKPDNKQYVPLSVTVTIAASSRQQTTEDLNHLNPMVTTSNAIKQNPFEEIYEIKNTAISTIPVNNDSVIIKNSNRQKIPLAQSSSAAAVDGFAGIGVPLPVTSSSSSPTSFSATSPGGHSVLQLVENLNRRLKDIRNLELGVTIVQEIFDTMDFTTIIRNDTDTASKIAKRIASKINKTKSIVMKLSDFLLNNITIILSPSNISLSNKNLSQTNTTKIESIYLNTIIQPCPFDDFTIEQNYNKHQIEILNYLKSHSKISSYHQRNTDTPIEIRKNDNRQYYDNSSHHEIIDNASDVDDDSDLNDVNLLANSEIINEMNRLNNDKSINLKHLYFLSQYDDASDHSCQYYFNDLNFRHLFVSAIKRKYLFIIIDHGNSMNMEQLELSKAFARNIINLLSATDTITIVTVAEQAKLFKINGFNSTGHRYMATMDNRYKILKFLNQLNRSMEPTNHSDGFRLSFELLRNEDATKSLNFENQLQLIYISRGLLSPLTEAELVLKTIANGQRMLIRPIKINTCVIILDEKRVMFDKQFLRDIAKQNYTNYGINVSDWYASKGITANDIKGEMFIVTKRHPELMVKTSCAIFQSQFVNNVKTVSLIEYHLPITDYNTKDSIVPMTLAVPPYGVIGANIHLNNLAEDVIYYKKTDDNYAFLINIDGITIFHPAFSITKLMDFNSFNHNTFPVDIRYLEREIQRNGVRERILNEEIGNATISIQNDKKESITYTWQRILDAYIVCIVTILKPNGRAPVKLSRVAPNLRQQYHKSVASGSSLSATGQPLSSSDIHPSAIPDLLYHRIDLISPSTPICQHFRSIASLDSGTVFLSASSFESPFVYSYNNNNNNNNHNQEKLDNRNEDNNKQGNGRKHHDDMLIRNAQSIMGYIKDITNLLANPGLKPEIRNDVSALYHVLVYLKKRHLEGGLLKKYIIRRYAATTNGVIVIFPGTVLNINLDPMQRPWYRKAMKYSGRIIATEPYLDAAGGGYIVTIAHTIFEGKANALHNADRDQPIAIVAIDIPYGFFYKLILDTTNFCTDPNIKCIIMDDSGYLLAHPSVMEPSTPLQNNRRPYEHITHKESFLANDILNHKNLVRKIACANYQNRTIQRYYTFNTSLNEILTNIVNGERTKYQIGAIHGTNLFAIILNSTCDGGAFCPCSTVDRVCLNCKRMDQMDCECPCECQLDITITDATIMADGYRRQNGGEIDFVKTEMSDVYVFDELTGTRKPILNSSLNYCEPLLLEDSFLINDFVMDDKIDGNTLKSCNSINCDLYTTQIDCLGIIGCEWCQLDIDGNPFTVPFCTVQQTCFNGVLGSLTPYGDGDVSTTIIDQQIPPAYSAIGPVGGAIIALCLVVGFAMYCYRQNMDSGTEHLYGNDSQQDDNYGLPLSRFNYDDISPHDNSDLGGNGNGNGHNGTNNIHSNLLNSMCNAIAIPDISPYHMSTNGYRRPTQNNGESDHGYSTMTPHEDSEHMCFALVEPLINNKRHSMSDSMSIHTSVSSPTNQNPLMPIDKHLPYDGNTGTIIMSNTSPTNATIKYQVPSPIFNAANVLLKQQQHKQQLPQQISSQRTSLPITGQTILPSMDQQSSPHHILAPVTVHRHMEAL